MPIEQIFILDESSFNTLFRIRLWLTVNDCTVHSAHERAGGQLICVFRSPVAELKLAPFGRPRSPFLYSAGRCVISLGYSLSLSPSTEASLSFPPGCSLGSLSSPVRASNPSWTKVLPAPSHVGRTFPHPDARRFPTFPIGFAIGCRVSGFCERRAIECRSRSMRAIARRAWI